MNWVGRKIHLYNVTMGLYMLDWWERYLFNILVAVLLWFICYNTWRSATDLFNSESLERWNKHFSGVQNVDISLCGSIGKKNELKDKVAFVCFSACFVTQPSGIEVLGDRTIAS